MFPKLLHLHWLLEEQWNETEKGQIPPRPGYFSWGISAFLASLWWAGADWGPGWGLGWWAALCSGSELSLVLVCELVQRGAEALLWAPGAAPPHSHSNPPLGNHCLQEIWLSESCLMTWMEEVWLVLGVRAPHNRNSPQIPHWKDYLMFFHH